MTTDNPRVFISYSHDSDEHRARVLGLSERLRNDGVETRLDQYVPGTPAQGWPRWMLDQLDWAEFVLVVCTESYYRRFRGHESPGVGKGVDWEGALITQEINDAQSAGSIEPRRLTAACHSSLIRSAMPLEVPLAVFAAAFFFAMTRAPAVLVQSTLGAG